MTSNDSISDKIIKKIKRNRISTTEVADCLGKKGALTGIYPINEGHYKVGRINIVHAYNGSNWELHEQIECMNEGEIVVVESHNCNNKALFGDLVSKYLLLYKGATAIVVNGYLRDVQRLKKEDYSIWCEGFTPIGCHNIKNEDKLDPKIIERWKQQYEGGVAVCDDAGVVIISKDNINEEFLEKLDFIELQEDIWYYCIDRKKWSTYETVCLKKYLDTELLPEELKGKFEGFISKINKT